MSLDYLKDTELIPMTFGGLISVTTENILQRPITDYHNLVKGLFRNDNQGGLEGYILERCWLLLWKYQPKEKI